MGKTFDQYKAEHARDPFPLPMPDGPDVLVPPGSIDTVMAARLAAREDPGNPFAGLEATVGDADAARVREAWGKLPPAAWDAMVADMQEHFGRGNSPASPAS